MSATGDGTGDETLTAVLDRLDAAGMTGQFTTRDGGTVECLTCRVQHPAALIDADAATRLEGASDPDDMVLITPVTCPACGTGGPLVLAYGPEASAADLDVVAQLHRNPTAATPGISP